MFVYPTEDDLKEAFGDKASVISGLERSIIEIIWDYGEEEILLGDSKRGGKPDLPIDFDWPEYEGEAMVFFAQINCKDLPKFGHGLPDKGWLFFFAYFAPPVNEYGSPYQFLFQKNRFKVLYYDGSISEMETHYYPSNLCDKFHFPARKLLFSHKKMFPPTLSIAVKLAGLSDDEARPLSEYRYAGCATSTKMLGYPLRIQDDVIYDFGHQLFDAYERDMSPEEYQKVEAMHEDFVVLLEFVLGGEFYLEKVFEDYRVIGRSNAYFGILKEDLKALNFDKAFFVLQDT